MTNRYKTSFIESEALLAVTADDVPYAFDRVQSMTNFELERLAEQAEVLSALCRIALQRRSGSELNRWHQHIASMYNL